MVSNVRLWMDAAAATSQQKAHIKKKYRYNYTLHLQNMHLFRLLDSEESSFKNTPPHWTLLSGSV